LIYTTLIQCVYTNNTTVNCFPKKRKALYWFITTNGYKKAVLSQGNRAMPQVFFFGLKFADNIHYKYKCSQASKARLQSSKHTGTKHSPTYMLSVPQRYRRTDRQTDRQTDGRTDGRLTIAIPR